MKLSSIMETVRKLDPVDQNLIMLVITQQNPEIMNSAEFDEWCEEMNALPDNGKAYTVAAFERLEGKPYPHTH